SPPSPCFLCLRRPRPRRSPLFPYTTLFRSAVTFPLRRLPAHPRAHRAPRRTCPHPLLPVRAILERATFRSRIAGLLAIGFEPTRSEEHTSELHHVKISYAVFCLKKKSSSAR